MCAKRSETLLLPPPRESLGRIFFVTHQDAEILRSARLLAPEGNLIQKATTRNESADGCDRAPVAERHFSQVGVCQSGVNVV